MSAATEAFTSSGTTLEVVAPPGTRTNLALYSRDFTNAAWAKTSVTALKNVTGVDGTANGASRLTASGANGTVFQALTLGSAARYASFYVKRLTGTGAVSVTLDGGSTYTAITTDLANAAGGWVRVSASQTLANPSIGFKLATSADAIAVDFAQLEITGVSPPIPTTSAAVTQKGIAGDASSFAMLFAASTGLTTEVNEITNMGEFGRKYNTVNHTPLNTRGTRKLKGNYDDGELALTLARAPGDAGQAVLVAALNSDENYYFAVTLQDASKLYFGGQVTSYTTNIGGGDQVTAAAVALNINTPIVEV